MKKRILAFLLSVCLLFVFLPAGIVFAAEDTILNFCDIDFTTEAWVYDEELDEYVFEPMAETWVKGTEDYRGKTNYIMSTNSDKENGDFLVFNNTTYAISFTMPYTGLLKFKASVSSEVWWDYLTVETDMGELYSTKDIYDDDWNETPWIDVSLMVRKDDKIYIGYSKDSSVSNGEDRAYLADITLEDLGNVFSYEIADTGWYDEEETEFEISTKEELCGFSKLVNQGVTFKDCEISLANDIDMSGIIWDPAGQYNFDLYGFSYADLSSDITIFGMKSHFEGAFDGQGNTISNLTCKYSYPYSTYIGFIGMNFGSITDLELVDPIIGDGQTAKSAGAVAGYNGGHIQRCVVTGGKIDIKWDKYLMAYAGGLVGTNGYAFSSDFIELLNYEGGTILECYSEADVQVEYDRSGYFGGPDYELEVYLSIAGGLLGATYGGLVADCYATGDVHAIATAPQGDDEEPVPVDTFAISGGFLGMVLSALPEMGKARAMPEEPEDPVVTTVTNCYATGAVTVEGPTPARSLNAGFLGFARDMAPAEPSYRIVIENSYFDEEATGRENGFKKQASFDGVTGKSSADMKKQGTFADWDFEEVWSIDSSVNNGYPILTDLGVGRQFTVTFKDHNDTVLKTETVYRGNSATAPSSPTREGYVFSEWDKAFNAVTEDITVNAVYRRSKLAKGDIIIEGVDGASFDKNTTLSQENITDTLTSADKNNYNIKIHALQDGKELLDLYNIRLMLNDTPVQPDGSVRVRIKLSEQQLAFSDLQIIYIDDSGNLTIIPSTVEDGYISFIVSHFSKYGIIGTPQAKQDTTQTTRTTQKKQVDTGNSIPAVPILLLVAMIPIVLVSMKRKHPVSAEYIS
ncbi:MAG TPA: hypothetical protein DEP23_00505 [Ruminococcaceae bacterium]|jgi:hypothetical protein|nr:hypothetical protein [Oscillospiraceae bacterium]